MPRGLKVEEEVVRDRVQTAGLDVGDAHVELRSLDILKEKLPAVRRPAWAHVGDGLGRVVAGLSGIPAAPIGRPEASRSTPRRVERETRPVGRDGRVERRFGQPALSPAVKVEDPEVASFVCAEDVVWLEPRPGLSRAHEVDGAAVRRALRLDLVETARRERLLLARRDVEAHEAADAALVAREHQGRPVRSETRELLDSFRRGELDETRGGERGFFFECE